MEKRPGKKPGSEKTGGRKKGTPNKATPLRKFVEELLTSNQEQLIADFKKLRPFQRMLMFEKLAKYCLPQLQSVTAEIEIDKYSDEQLATVIAEIKNGLK